MILVADLIFLAVIALVEPRRISVVVGSIHISIRTLILQEVGILLHLIKLLVHVHSVVLLRILSRRHLVHHVVDHVSLRLVKLLHSAVSEAVSPVCLIQHQIGPLCYPSPFIASVVVFIDADSLIANGLQEIVRATVAGMKQQAMLLLVLHACGWMATILLCGVLLLLLVVQCKRSVE